MKLLLDENFSRRIFPKVSEIFPGSTHVELVGLAGATDLAICEFASAQGFAVVTKDEDFDRLVALRGFDPKLIRLTFGNSNNNQIAEVLIRIAELIKVQLRKQDIGIIEVG